MEEFYAKSTYNNRDFIYNNHYNNCNIIYKQFMGSKVRALYDFHDYLYDTVWSKKVIL